MRSRLSSPVVFSGIFLLALCSPGSSPDYPVAEDQLLSLLTSYDALPEASTLSLADAEPGEALVILGRLVRAGDGEPIAGRPIYFYQADATGIYGEAVPGEESTARVSGGLVSGPDGRFLLRTILPGDYGQTEGNRHIHMTVEGARPEAYDFYFSDHAGAGLRNWARGSRQAVLLELARHDQTLIAVTDLPVHGFSAPEQDRTENSSPFE